MLTMVRNLNGWDHEPNAVEHPKSEHVRYSSPHCIYLKVPLYDHDWL